MVRDRLPWRDHPHRRVVTLVLIAAPLALFMAVFAGAFGVPWYLWGSFLAFGVVTQVEAWVLWRSHRG